MSAFKHDMPGCGSGCTCSGSPAPWGCTPAGGLTMTWYYYIHPYPATNGPIVTALPWNGAGAFDSGVQPLPPDAYAANPTPLEGLPCFYYQMRIFCCDGTNCRSVPGGRAPNGYIFIWHSATGPDPDYNSGQPCNLATNQPLQPASGTGPPYSATYGPNDVIAMARGLLTP